jgi:thymidylate synthase
MKSIEKDTIGEAHEEIIKQILIEGSVVMTKHGITLEYPGPISVLINHPFQEPVKSKAYNFPLEGMKMYAEQLQTVSPSAFDYNCGNRWFDYPMLIDASDIEDNLYQINGDGNQRGFNQIDRLVIDELKKDPSSRRAVITSLVPQMDINKKHIPCISFLQFLIRDKKLNLTAYIRSNDMLSAWGSDAYALSQLQKYVAKMLNIECSYLEIISVSAHIYFKRDADELMKFRRTINW